MHELGVGNRSGAVGVEEGEEARRVARRSIFEPQREGEFVEREKPIARRVKGVKAVEELRDALWGEVEQGREPVDFE